MLVMLPADNDHGWRVGVRKRDQRPGDGNVEDAPFVTAVRAVGHRSPRHGRLALILTNTGNIPASGLPTLTILASVAGSDSQTLATPPLRDVKLRPGSPDAYRMSSLPADLAAATYTYTVWRLTLTLASAS